MEQTDGGGDWPMTASRCSDDVRNDYVLDDDDQEETSKFETYGKPLSTEWTNEKHSLYLKSIEASFVDQLYSNMGFPTFQTSRKPSTEPKPHFRSSVRTSAGQFKTLRGGYWQKINVGKGQLIQSDGENTPLAILSNPWIRHYIHSDQDVNSRGKAALPHRFNRSLKISSNPGPSNSHRLVSTDDDDTEASGQNFVNEDIAEENASGVCSSRPRVPTNDSSSSCSKIDP